MDRFSSHGSNSIPLSVCAALLVAGALALAVSAPTAACVLALAGENFDLSWSRTTQRLAPAPAYNSRSDEYMVVWFDTRNPGNNDVFGQRVDADGSLLETNFPVIEFAEAQIDPWIAYNPEAGEYLVAWRTQQAGYFNRGRGRRVAANGTLIGPDFLIGNGHEISIAYNGAENQFLVTGRSPDIRGRRVSHDGTLVGPEIIITTVGAPAPNGQVAYDRVNDRYLATWRDQVAENLKGQLIAADGTLIGGPILISPLFPGSGRAASVAHDPQNDRYLVVFGLFQGAEIYAQFVSGSGSLIGSNFLVASNLTAPVNPFVVHDAPVGCYVVCWKDGIDVLAQALTLAGELVGSPLLVASRTVDGEPTAAANTLTGDVLVVWTDNRNLPQGEMDIYGQIVTCGDAGAVFTEQGSTRREGRSFVMVTPNPSWDQATIFLSLASAAPVTLEILSADGQLVRTLRSGLLPAGLHGIVWDGEDNGGRPALGGVYLVRARGDDAGWPRGSKLLLLR